MRFLSVLKPIGVVAVLSACSAPKDAPSVPSSNVVQWSAIAGPLRPGPDNSMLLDVDLRASLIEGWHVYSLGQTEGGPTPMSVTVGPMPPYTLDGRVTGPPAVKAKDPNFGIETETYSGEQIFRVPVKLDGSAVVSPPPLDIKVRSQACSDRLCLPARTTTVTVQPATGST
jgi:hypothetical protein